MVYVALPESVRRIPLSSPELARGELVEIIGQLRGMGGGAAVDLEPIAHEAVDGALRHSAFLLAMVTPPDAHPAVLNGVALDFPIGWDATELEAELLREAMENGGPDVRETMTLTTPIGKAVVVQRIPGAEQARMKEPLTLQLQGLVVDPASGALLLLTLASPARAGWENHQRMFLTMMASINTEPDAAERLTAGQTPPTTQRPTPADEDDYFQPNTFKVT